MTKKFIVKGLVQGIGYRPFVARLAEELNIAGTVRNTGGIVTIVACGESSALEVFKDRLASEVPTGGFITSIDEVTYQDEKINAGFQIIESDRDLGENLPLVPADIATCDNCKKELLDKNNRRYRHPFISCTVCGPRYSIIEKLPYDRDTITMADFPMCNECKSEYTGKKDIRRHAQTIACKNCGPKLKLTIVSGGNKQLLQNENPLEFKDEIKQAAAVIKSGGIVAIKDIGGYHLSCDPFNEIAVEFLRKLKHREAKAFAIMFENVESVKEYADVNEKEESLLNSPARPIVLVRRKNVDKIHGFAGNVCLSSPDVGAMLPCNPVQILLAKECGPIIMTSGNGSGDVLETEDDKMLSWLKDRLMSAEMKGATIAILSHNRRILRPMDDSVMKVVRGHSQFIRRARGYVPNPIKVDIDGELFAAGGDLKSSFCYTKNGLAYVSQYLGDLESVSCQDFYLNEKRVMANIFGFNPVKNIVDKHPGYFSSGVNNDLPVKKIQHHKAHVASVIVEHNIKGEVLGVAFDGTGYGDDGTIWGSEFFVWDGHNMERVGHLRPQKLIGGNEGAKNCNTILIAMIHGNGLDDRLDKMLHSLGNGDEIITAAPLIRSAIDMNINTISSSSMGRLFDAVSALLDICHYNSYEGQAPIELENVASTTSVAYPLHIGESGETRKLFEEIIDALEKKIAIAEIARGFIYAVAEFISNTAKRANVKQVVLSGGTFLNRILLEQTIDSLENDGFKVYFSEQLPPGDGGICLGQAYLSKYVE